MNIIKNPEFVFDINKTEIVDASLSTIAQTFIDSCAMTESDFGLVRFSHQHISISIFNRLISFVNSVFFPSINHKKMSEGTHF